MKKAFSLAELLLAVGIVAVISTLMITTVIPKGDEKKYATITNKAYLTLQEAYGVQILNDGGRDASDYGSNKVLSRMTSGATPALPYYEKNSSTAQLPNGMIIYNSSNYLYVDLDGIEGKTKSILAKPPSSADKDKADILRFRINGSELTPDYDFGYAREYFEYDESLQ